MVLCSIDVANGWRKVLCCCEENSVFQRCESVASFLVKEAAMELKLNGTAESINVICSSSVKWSGGTTTTDGSDEAVERGSETASPFLMCTVMPAGTSMQSAMARVCTLNRMR